MYGTLGSKGLIWVQYNFILMSILIFRVKFLFLTTNSYLRHCTAVCKLKLFRWYSWTSKFLTTGFIYFKWIRLEIIFIENDVKQYGACKYIVLIRVEALVPEQYVSVRSMTVIFDRVNVQPFCHYIRIVYDSDMASNYIPSYNILM